MSERQKSPYDSIAGRWLVLVERRQQNFIELCNSGRWRHYYTQAQFLQEMRNVLHLRNQWARLAGFPVGEQTDYQQASLQVTEPQNGSQDNLKQSDRGLRNLGTQQVQSPRRAGEGRRLSASAILAAVAGRL